MGRLSLDQADFVALNRLAIEEPTYLETDASNNDKRASEFLETRFTGYWAGKDESDDAPDMVQRFRKITRYLENMGESQRWMRRFFLPQGVHGLAVQFRNLLVSFAG